MRKILGVIFSLSMLLTAGSALAAATVSESGISQMPGFMEKMQKGQLSAEEQKSMYNVMQPQGGQNVLFFNKGAQPGMMAYGPGRQVELYKGGMVNGNAMVWMQLMSVISVALIWVVLLLGIALMWKQLRKKH